MQAQRHTAHLAVRASPTLLKALSERASQAGCSTSEFVRSIIREKVGLQ